MLHTQNLAAVSKVPRSAARIKKEEGSLVEYAYLKAGLNGLNRESGQQKLPNEGEDKSNTSCDWSSNKSTEAADLDPEDFNTHLRAMQKKFHAKEAELELALSRLKSREAELECAMHDRDKAEARAAAYNAELSEVRKHQMVVPIGSALPDSQEASSAQSAYVRPECKTEEGSRLPTQYGHVEPPEDMLHSISRREHASLLSCITEVNALRDSTRGLTAHAVASLGGILDANDGNLSCVHKLADVEAEGHRLEGTALTPLSPCWTVPEQEVLSRQASSTTTFAATVSTRGPDWTGGSSSADPTAQPAYSSAPSSPREKTDGGFSPSVPATLPWDPRHISPLSGGLSQAPNERLIDLGSAMGSAQSALSSGHGSATPGGQPRAARDSLLHHTSAPNFRLPGRRLGSSADVHAARNILGARTKEEVSLSPRTSPTRSFRVVQQPFASPNLCSRSISLSRDQSPSLRFSLLSTLPGQSAPNLQAVPPEISAPQLPGASAPSMKQEAVLAAVSPLQAGSLQAGQQRSPRPSLSPPAEMRTVHMPATIIDQARKLSPVPVHSSLHADMNSRTSGGNKDVINAAVLASPTLFSRGVSSCASLATTVEYGLRQRSPRGVEIQKVSPAAWQAQPQYQVSPLERMSPRTCRPPDIQNQNLQHLDQLAQVPDANPLSPGSQKDAQVLYSHTRASEKTPTWRPTCATMVDEVVLGTSTPITRRSPPCSPNITSRESHPRPSTIVGFRAGSSLLKRTV